MYRIRLNRWTLGPLLAVAAILSLSGCLSITDPVRPDRARANAAAVDSVIVLTEEESPPTPGARPPAHPGGAVELIHRLVESVIRRAERIVGEPDPGR